MEDVLGVIAVVLVCAGLFIFMVQFLEWLNGESKPQAKSSINYEPRGDRVLVKRLERPQPKEGDVFLPTSQQKPLNSGVVVAVGPGARNRVTGKIDSVELELGDKIEFLDYAGFTVDVDGEEYLSMRDEEIHGRRRN